MRLLNLGALLREFHNKLEGEVTFMGTIDATIYTFKDISHIHIAEEFFGNSTRSYIIN